MEEVDDPVDGVDDMDHPGEVVDDVEEGVLVLDRLDGLVRVEDEEEEQHEQVQEAENGAPIAPESRSKNQKILEKEIKGMEIWILRILYTFELGWWRLAWHLFV